MSKDILDDGSRLETAWHDALNSSVAYFRALLSSSSSSAWKLVSGPPRPPPTSGSVRDGKGRSASLGRITPSDVTIHRRNGKGGEVFRAVVDVDCGTDVNVDTFRGCLATPETRPVWDSMVDEAQLLNLLDTQTRVTKTNYRLGWPSSPRDAVTISRTMVDQHTLIDVSTSLPRSRHEPPYLRPAPPYVRAHVSLLAWCIQLPGVAARTVDPPLPEGKARITCFWSWNPKGTWAVGGAVPQHLPTVIVGLVDFVRDGSEKMPSLLSYGDSVIISDMSYDPARVMLSTSYNVIKTDDIEDGTKRQLEFGMSSTLGWDVQIQAKNQNGEDSSSTMWNTFVGQLPPLVSGSPSPKRLLFRLNHAQLRGDDERVIVKVSIEQTASSPTRGRVRINGTPVPVQQMESIAPLHFTALLQEPEPKWKPVAESKGVSVHQLNSMDKTLVVYRAEAVFVGVGVWDLFATIITPGTQPVWDKTYEDATLLEDVSELTDVWHFKSKPSWPTSARDSVLVRTTYKSPSSVHIFGFSTEDNDLFPVIPPCIDPNVIRTQIDLQGWSIEALSPNTTQVTLLEQSHPGGWSNKSSIPQVMMTALAGMGEFAIKHGAPPVVTRLGGAKAVSSRYDLEKETYRIEYEPDEGRKSDSSCTATAFPGLASLPEKKEFGDAATISSKMVNGNASAASTIECGIRCDPDKWSNSILVLIDPPPKGVSALRRHRLSPSGGGLWLTIEHDAAVLGSDSVTLTVRRGAATTGGKTSLTVNGSKLKIDNEDLSEGDVKQLQKQKRSRASRAALDQPPAMGVLRKRQSNMSMRSTAQDDELLKTATQSSLFGRITTPFSMLYSSASETRATLVPMAGPTPTPASGSTPVDAAMRALSQLTRIHADRDGESTDPFGWQPVAERDGLKVEKRTVSHVSDSFPVFRAGRIIEGFTAEEVSASVSAFRKTDYFDKPERLQTYGYGITTSHVVAHTAFPFRSRSALVATVVARVPDSPPPSPSVASHASLSTIFHASSSMFDSVTLGLDPSKYNPSVMPTCNFIIEGWILETIDPYSHEQYAIPSTRCMYVGALDYGGNIPVSVNNMLNGGLPRALLHIENALKTQGPPSRSRWPTMSVSTPDPPAQGPWALDGIEAYKVPIDQVIDGDDYVITVTVQPPTGRDIKLRPVLSHSDSKSSMASSRSHFVDYTEDLRRGRRDLIVAEIDVAAELVKNGCEIAIRAVSLPEAYHGPGGSDASVLPLDYPGDKLGMPFKCSVISLAPSVLQTASLDPTSQTRHMLRVTLPTSGYEAPVNDPLTGKTAPLPRPRWLLDLINDGAVVQVRLLPRRSDPPAYMFEGTELSVEDERKSLRHKEPIKLKLPQVVNAPGAVSLDKPLAIARQYLPDTPPAPAPQPEGDSDTNSLDTKTPTNERAELPPEKKEELAPEPNPKVIPPAPAPRYTFWRLPMKFSASAPASKHASPVRMPAPLPSERASPAPKSSLALEPITEAAPSVAERLTVPVPLPAVIIACLICLLLGSLLRSLLSEADFVIYPPSGTAPPEGEVWRELKRLGEWRIGWNTDLIVALARRRE
ncbi:uncharacterized protein CcaverHIS019_0303010 [Cutaneotrichosporon cavernicola]|uniref:START domain-containing protein n=1 Tax=Cutaneotrichosporon cavernicola TaxID=279322 RepID=A0AA48L0R1_9TREE|nr:uncharacterized protein CcaverHIS019_0303010 [Cutaneotrichosporon cavernicola]BEI90231.1 hypothetical protein CcaverHIS019_0303010 [Cutaneotrichosporon cavernicola]BEI98010.1 hypothetical protein CcaverHIS631_0303090 [Cutaneotrichosporon cavernicola]BEJ05786.1 hypothetical protein CcaverHIS641_0303080 [Cutaneotrichosporon cavernicola]